VPPQLRDQHSSHLTSNGVRSQDLRNLSHQHSTPCQSPSTTSARNGCGRMHHVLNLSKPSKLAASCAWLWTLVMSTSADFTRFMPRLATYPEILLISHIDFTCRTLRVGPATGINTMVQCWIRTRKPS
jgi:hypothetical protein